MNEKQEILLGKPDRRKLQDFLPYDEDIQLRKDLHKWGLENYQPKYSKEEQFKYMNTFPCSFRENENQCTNYPYYFTMFSINSQFVQGDTVEECLDKALDIFNGVTK